MTTGEEIWEIAMDAENDSQVVFNKIQRMLAEARASEREEIAKEGVYFKKFVEDMRKEAYAKGQADLHHKLIERISSWGIESHIQIETQTLRRIMEIIDEEWKASESAANCACSDEQGKYPYSDTVSIRRGKRTRVATPHGSATAMQQDTAPENACPHTGLRKGLCFCCTEIEPKPEKKVKR